MRPSPFDLVFREFGEGVFPRIRSALTQAGHDPRDRDRFLMVREVVTLLLELRPEEGVGEGIDQLAALLHHAYLHWDSGENNLEVPLESLPWLMMDAAGISGAADSGAAYYVAMPEHRIWAQVISGHPPEPLDGCFVDMGPRGSLRVLGVFGIHPERQGFTVVEATGERPPLLARADGSDLFAPTLPGGKAAGLFSVTGEEELLELGWRLQLGARSWGPGAKSPDHQEPASSSQHPAASTQLLAPNSQLPAPSS